MNDQRITRLEARLEQLIEGVFTSIFGKRIRAHDIALQLARVMETGIKPPADGDPRPVAPNYYTITVNTDVRAHILQRYPTLDDILSGQVVELAASFGYRLNHKPIIIIVGDDHFAPGRVFVEADHSVDRHDTTDVMKPITLPASTHVPRNPQLMISGEKVIPVIQALITIGRSQDNDIILEDPYVSRHHAQLRLRFGHYTLFDADSQSGTFVNDVRIREHRLQSGDVIRIGATSMVYMEDSPPSDHQTGLLDAV